MITGGTATATIFNIGEGYAGSDTITLSGADLGGADGTNDLTITVDSIYGSTSGTISNYVYRVSIQEGTSNNDFFGNLQDDVTNDTLLELRGSESFTFSGVANQDIVERPSTAINFDEDDNTTYRSTSFTTTDDQNNQLPSDGIKAVFDTEFDYVVTEIDSANTSVSAPSGGGTLGASASDTYIAVKRFPSENEFRILQDSTDSVNQNILLPGDGGYSGGMIFSFGGRSFRVKDYGPITTAPITNATQTNPVTITSAGHGLSNGQFIEFSDIVGMTDLNDKRYYVGDVTTDTFNLYTNEDLNSTLNGTQFSPYESGGRWFTTNTVWYLEIEYIAGTDIEGNSAAGVKTTPTTDREIHLGLIAGSTAEITVAISLLRATGHDFTQIGTGGYNTTNYPSVLLGPPVGGNAAKAGFYSDEDNASKAQVWERRKGRVFFISSDNDGFFRVGKFFEVDQSTGSITFAGEVGISRAAKLGFKDGVTVDEFSNDELFTDNSDTAVPTEKAIANYVSRRLGHDGTAQLTGASRFQPGFLALNGSTPMEANLNMNSKQIKNLLDPVDDNDATTKDFVDQAVSNYDEFDDLRNVTIHNVAPADVSKQLVAPTGLQRVITTPENPGNFVVSGTITDGTAQGTVRALESRFDKVLNQNIRIITYELTTVANFNTTLSTITDGVVGSPGSNSAEVLEAPVDEITNAVEASDSDINIEIIRNANNTEIDLQIEDQAIINSDVNNDAKISQSKFMMKRAKTIASSTGLYGIDDDDTLGRTGQGNRGLAAFEADSFAEDVQLKFADPGQVTASAGDVIIQGSNRGYVVANITNSQTVVVRTADTFVTDDTQISLATVDGTGEEQTAVLLVDGADDPITLDSALNGYVRRSGYINLKDRGVDYSKLPELPTDTVIGRRQDGTGRSESVTFAQVVDEGFGLADGDFTNELAYGDPRNDPGKVLIQTGTAGDGNYAYSEISYENENNSIAKRDNTGSIQATSYILGGDSEQVVLSESASTITFSTPAGGTILTSNGSSKPVINTGGKIKVGDIANVDESTFHGNSTFGTGQSAAEESAVATRWLYTSFIEAPDEKNAQGTGIGIGGGTGFGAGGADTIIFVTGGNVEAKVTTTGLEADDVRSISTNTNLTLSGNGTGSVIVADNLRVDGSITLNANLTNAIVYEGTANAHETRLIFTDPTEDRDITFPNATGTVAVSGGSSTTQSGLDLSVSAAGVISGSAEGLATTDSPTFAGLTVSDTNNLTTRRITTGAAATTGTVTGRWSLTTDSRFEATYADLGEYYQGDAEYEVGTVVVFGGEQEVTISTQHRDTRIAGVVSDQSAYTMNSECPGLKNLIALQGRVPVKVIGRVSKGDMLVASAIPGFAVVDNNPVIGSVIGKAVGEKLDTEKGIVEAVVGRV